MYSQIEVILAIKIRFNSNDPAFYQSLPNPIHGVKPSPATQAKVWGKAKLAKSLALPTSHSFRPLVCTRRMPKILSRERAIRLIAYARLYPTGYSSLRDERNQIIL